MVTDIAARTATDNYLDPIEKECKKKYGITTWKRKK